MCFITRYIIHCIKKKIQSKFLYSQVKQLNELQAVANVLQVASSTITICIFNMVYLLRVDTDEVPRPRTSKY